MSTKFTQTSKPPQAKAYEIIDDISAEIDGVLVAAGYTLPVAGTASLAMLRRYATYGAAAACWHTGIVSDTDKPRVVYWTNEYNNFLARLRRGEQYLPDTTLPQGDTEAAFGIAPAIQRDGYWLTREGL